jgi:hypothetical protein
LQWLTVMVASIAVACPDPHTLLTPKHQAHLAECVECQLAAGVLREAGLIHRIGRYRIDHILGEGAMGVVYAAFDEELRRAVAVKVIRPEIASEQARLRMLREAQALAQLSHPNVVTVYEAGCEGDRLFIALELVVGDTLRGYLARKPSWTKALAVAASAGRGLVAIHSAGLVHRDFKPENVLVGNDGRVRVGDLGLSCAERSVTGIDEQSLLESPLTEHGALLGTPLYMAPEQLAGATADARSDQFAFCTVLYEAVYGERPFAALDRGSVRLAPRSSRVPRWLRSSILRGLAVRPADRHESMAALLDAIASGKRRQRARRTTTFVATAALAAGLTGWMMSDRGSAGLRCDDAAAKIDDVWNLGRKQRVEDAFRRTRHPLADMRAAQTIAALDVYARSWSAMRIDASRATHERGEQSQARLDERMACLDARLSEVDAQITLLESADRERVEHATQIDRLLRPVDGCIDPSASVTPAPRGSELGRISDFDDGTLSTRFGAGWFGVTDRIMGGSSDVKLEVVAGGADHSSHALSITGQIGESESGMRWAGAMFSPGSAAHQPANLSKMRAIRFSAKGDARHYGVAMFSSSLGQMPAIKGFDVTNEWQRFEFLMTEFSGLTTFDLTGVMFTTDERPGAFALQIDNVTFVE